MVETIISRARPFIESIGRRRAMDVVIQGSAIAEPRLLLPPDAHGRTVACRFTQASPDRDDGGVRIRVYVEAIVSGLQHSECLVGSVDFEGLTVIQTPHMQVHCALVQLQLNNIFADIGKGKAAFGIDADNARAYAYFGAGILVGPYVIGIRQRTVKRAANPVIGAVRLHGNRATHELQASGASWWVGLIRLICLIAGLRIIGLVVPLGVILAIVLRHNSGTRHERQKRKNAKKAVKSLHKPSLGKLRNPEVLCALMGRVGDSLLP
jgi:hypothetical protein